ncbi:MAG: protein phosphatase 2C domain-containing protein [Methanoculleus sp.]
MKRELGLRYAAVSERGRRERNEDSCFAGVIAGHHIFAIADGLGGHASGDTASGIAVTTLEETVGDGLGDVKPSILLERAFQNANTALRAYNREKNQNAASTLSAAIIDGSGRCWIGTVGDSRTYIITPRRSGIPATRATSRASWMRGCSPQRRRSSIRGRTF